MIRLFDSLYALSGELFQPSALWGAMVVAFPFWSVYVLVNSAESDDGWMNPTLFRWHRRAEMLMLPLLYLLILEHGKVSRLLFAAGLIGLVACLLVDLAAVLLNLIALLAWLLR